MISAVRHPAKLSGAFVFLYAVFGGLEFSLRVDWPRRFGLNHRHHHARPLSTDPGSSPADLGIEEHLRQKHDGVVVSSPADPPAATNGAQRIGGVASACSLYDMQATCRSSLSVGHTSFISAQERMAHISGAEASLKASLADDCGSHRSGKGWKAGRRQSSVSAAFCRRLPDSSAVIKSEIGIVPNHRRMMPAIGKILNGRGGGRKAQF